MNNEQKITLGSIILDYLASIKEDKKAQPVHVGHLNKTVGQVGFKSAEVGQPVFETNDRYFIFLESLDGKRSIEVHFYKDDLKHAITPL